VEDGRKVCGWGGVEWLCIIWTLEESDARKDLGLVEKRENSVPNLYIDKGSIFLLHVMNMCALSFLKIYPALVRLFLDN